MRFDPRQLDLFPVLGKPRAGPSFAVLERKLGGVRHELHNIQVTQRKPGTPERLEMLRRLERSVRAEIKLRWQAIAHGACCRLLYPPKLSGSGTASALRASVVRSCRSCR
jgi:hypothetical protein